jgi:hypothetical protein
MKRNLIGPVIGTAAAALLMAGCATTRSAQEAPATRSETSRRGSGLGLNRVEPTTAKVRRGILTSSSLYTGTSPGERITYEHGDPEPPATPK